MRFPVCLPALTWLLCGTAVLRAQAPTPAQLDFFEKKIRPVLAEHCYACHSAEAKKQKGGLRLDLRDGWRKGGDSGSALTPGKPDASLLIKAVRYTDEDLKMPPKGKLPATVIADLEEWVRIGAPDPRDHAAAVKTTATWEEMLRTRRSWWSLQPVAKIAVPAVKNPAWSNHPVDRFLLAKLELAGLPPAVAADPRTLIRRLSLVLTGLPPTAAEVDDFVRESIAGKQKTTVPSTQYSVLDPGANLIPKAALEKLVERLLQSPHFGERWARHWMDVVRFSETHCNEWNYDVHHAWRYRDYLIRAFNDDLPYHLFVMEHIAGDMMPSRWNKKEQFVESLIGTAFYRFGEVNHDDCIGLPTLGYDILDNQIDTLTKAFQATTVACARCHDHKIDAVSMKDYYGLLGMLRSSRPATFTLNQLDVREKGPLSQMRNVKNELRRALAQVWLRDVQTLDEKRLDEMKVDKTTWEHPLHCWRKLKDEKEFGLAASGFASDYVYEAQQRRQFNRKNYHEIGDFCNGPQENWRTDGHGAIYGFNSLGDFTVAPLGDRMLGRILPAGCFTHSFSESLNGALRSGYLPADKKRVSFHVMGRKQAAVRLVSNGCQLNYRNFRALKSDALQWITFDIPDGAAALRCYAELMTKFDNPKYPDQLGQLGGDDSNQRVPWEKAAADPNSYFGIRQVVVHDVPEPPRDELAWLMPLVRGANLKDRAALAARYRECARHAVQVWMNGNPTDDDARWLDWLLQQGTLTNTFQAHSALERIVRQYRELESRLPLPQIVPGVEEVDFEQGIDQPVFLRGDCKKPGEVAPRRYLEVLTKPGKEAVASGSGRRQLADAIASAENPLTARVMVNRIWHHVFGYGLVRTTDDFGRMGDTPSHPELLDWLATRFVEDGWSVKKMIRLLVTSRAFQMASRADAKAAEIDPLNRLLHHYPARRMEAEAIRDSILATSGRLDRTLYGLSVLPYRDKVNEDRRLFLGPLDGNGRRSLYIKVNLMEAARFLSAFDLPGGKVCQGRRDVTNVPAQALALLNDPFVVQQAELWAKQLVQRPAETTAVRIEHMFQTALGRPPAVAERERLERFVAQLAEVHRVAADRLAGSVPVWQDAAHALFNVQEFVYIP